MGFSSMRRHWPFWVGVTTVAVGCAACGGVVAGPATPHAPTTAPSPSPDVHSDGGGSTGVIPAMPTSSSSCPISPQVSLPSVPHSFVIGAVKYELPDYGFGGGPVYLSGQTRWFAGETIVVLITPTYAQSVNVHLERWPSGDAQPVFGPGSTIRDPGSGWRFVDSTVGVDVPGCWQLRAAGPGLDESIVFSVLGGTPLPG